MRITILLAALTALAAAPPAAGALRLRITLAGSGSWATTYHSDSPNPGGAADRNDGHDSSSQTWKLTAASPLKVVCNGRCRIEVPRTAVGSERIDGTILHRHVDGLYSYDSYKESCRVSGSVPRGRTPALPVLARVTQTALILTVLNPLTEALLSLPAQCPGLGDPLDGFPENMFTPGFSFAAAWGPDRWFTSRPLVIPFTRLRHGPLTVRLAPRKAAVPPAGCAVRHPEYESCRTGGWWQETVRLAPVSATGP